MSRTSLQQRKYENKLKLQMTKEGHLREYANTTKYRAKKKGIPYDLTFEYLKSIATDYCPIFNVEFSWGRYNGRPLHLPSLDRVIPELGYIQGNVVFISNWANTIKQNATEKELYAIADWLHDKRKEVLNAFKEKLTPIPNQHTGEGQDNSQLGTIHGAGVGQDCDGSHHHRRKPEGQDLGDSTEAGCRICMGTGVQKMATLATFYSDQGNGDTLCSAEEFAKRIRCVCYQP